MESKKTYDLALSLGYSCGVSKALREAGLQFASFPLDWVAVPDIVRSAEIVASDFAHWIDREALELFDVRRGSGFNTRVYFNRLTGIGFSHEFGDFQSFAESYPKVVEMYSRRIARLKGLLEKSRRVLLVFLELPFRQCAAAADLARARELLSSRYPNASFDLVYVYEDPAASSPRVVSEKDGVTVLALDYRMFDHGEITHFVRSDSLTEYLRRNVTVCDYRTDAERERRRSVFESDTMCRWGRKGTMRSLVNRWAFRIFRHLEKYLMARGLVQREGPLWFFVRKGGV